MNPLLIKIINDTRFDQILYRSTHRGTKEMDILLGNFVKKYINTFNHKDLNDLNNIINCEENDCLH